MATLRIEETRRLVVPLDTAVDALLELDSARAGELFRGRLHSARVMGLDPGEEPGLRIVVEETHYGRATNKLRSSDFPLQIVAAALLSYCIKAHIPIPRAARKSIELTPEGFVMTLLVSNTLVRKHGTLPEAPAVPADEQQLPASAVAQLGAHLS